MSKIAVNIVTPTQSISKLEVSYLRAPSSDGLFGVKSNHAPSIIQIDVGEIKIIMDDKTEFLSTSGGFAEISKDNVKLLLETVELSNEIDTNRAAKSLEKAQKLLEAGKIDIQEAAQKIKKAKNRLKIAEKH